jgi:signal peptidase II
LFLEDRLKFSIKQYGFLALVAGIVIALDQWSKQVVRTTLAWGGKDYWSPWEWLTPYARIVHWDNSGVAFGMFQGRGYIFLVLALIVSVIIIYYYPRVAANDWILKTAMGLQLGGALGNAIDRVLFNGKVTDFISVGDFPVFNVADSGISVGVAVLLIGVWLQERRAKNSQPEEQAAAPLLDDNSDNKEISA